MTLTRRRIDRNGLNKTQIDYFLLGALWSIGKDVKVVLRECFEGTAQHQPVDFQNCC